MPRAPKTPRNRRIPEPNPPQTKPRRPFKFNDYEDRQILLAYFSLLPQPPDMAEVHRIMGTDAYSVVTLQRRFNRLHEKAQAVRDDRMKRKEYEPASSEHEGDSDYEGSDIFNEAPTPPESSDVSMSPETPVFPRRHRDSSPTARRHATRAADARGRARDSGSEIRRAVSAHPAARRQSGRDNYRPPREDDERPRGGREETLPPRQPLRGRRDDDRGSRDVRRDRSRDAYHPTVVVNQHR